MRFSDQVLAVSLSAAFLAGAPALASAQADADVVLGGTHNTKLSDGASALTVGDAERGIELTLAGLKYARGNMERRAALSNLCAGYLMLEQLDEALSYCNRALAINDMNWRVYNNRALIYVMKGEFELAEADLAKCEEIRPSGRSTKVVRQLLVHAKDPVAPMITVDDRRGAPTAENLDE